MRLRPRLALFTIVVSLPLLAGVLYAQRSIRERAETDALVEFVTLHMQSGERERCEANPGAWTGGMDRPPPADDARHEDGPPPGADDHQPPHDNHPHGGFGRGGPGPRLYAYDSAFHSDNTRAPALSAELISRLRPGLTSAHRTVDDEHGRAEETLVRTASSGPCAIVLAHRHAPMMRMWSLFAAPLTVVAVVVAAMLIALGPLVQRMRALAEAVSAQEHERFAELTRGHDEIADVARAFAAAQVEIRAQVTQKEQRAQALRMFLENTTHDVMTPLSVLLGSVGDMQQRLAEARAIDSALVGQIGTEAHYIAALIRNLATAARLDAGHPDTHFMQVDLNHIVARVMARHAPVARERHVELHSGVPEHATSVAADETLLEQALGNIVDNAIRYNHPKGHVAIVLERSGARFTLAVLDDGPGIAEEELSRLHERYYRGNQARTRGPGRGLGLNIVAQVAELHGWSLEFARSEYNGLRVALTGQLSEHEDASKSTMAAQTPRPQT